MKTGFIYDEMFLKHDPGTGHPECSHRLTASMNYFHTRPWFNELTHLSPKETDSGWLTQSHQSEYITRARDMCLSGAPYLDSMDVGICRDSYDVALLAISAGLTLADEVIHGNIDNGFALLRPPGHHAEKNMALGFCLFNNAAILASYLQQNFGVDKIMILDWDVHHGNGTQHIFEEDPTVLYISAHQYPFYPGTGVYTETGTGRGKDATLNCPMPAGSNDRDYEQIFMEKILPKIQQFKPEFIIISAGFDAHENDPLAEICLSTGFYGWMTERVMESANQHCHGRIISLLEGGYNLDVLPLCIEQHLLKLSQTT